MLKTISGLYLFSFQFYASEKKKKGNKRKEENRKLNKTFFFSERQGIYFGIVIISFSISFSLFNVRIPYWFHEVYCSLTRSRSTSYVRMCPRVSFMHEYEKCWCDVTTTPRHYGSEQPDYGTSKITLPHELESE